MAYRYEKKGRWKAIAAVVAVHLVLGAVIVTGLNVEIVGRAIDRLETFDITLDQPPPEDPPPPPLEADREKEPEGATGARPSEIVAPEPEIEVPTLQPIAAAPVAGTGVSSATGTGTSGSGPGSGGSVTGTGGGGTGAGNSPARLVRNLTHSDYRRLTSGRMASGSAGLAIGVSAGGRVESCRVEHSSGDPVIDSGLCQLVASRLRFDPARNAQGQPIPFFTHYRATWRR